MLSAQRKILLLQIHGRPQDLGPQGFVHRTRIWPQLLLDSGGDLNGADGIDVPGYPFPLLTIAQEGAQRSQPLGLGAWTQGLSNTVRRKLRTISSTRPLCHVHLAHGGNTRCRQIIGEIGGTGYLWMADIQPAPDGKKLVVNLVSSLLRTLLAPALAPGEPALIDASVGLARRDRGCWCAPGWKGSLDHALCEQGTRKAQKAAAHLALGAAPTRTFQHLN